MENNFKALHYDGTISLHSDLKTAMKEAVRRLEPWREGSDRVVQQINETSGSKLSRILVVNSVNQPTDAASHISPCGDWIDSRECLPKSNQRVLACWLEENEPVDITECNVTDTEFIRWAIKHAANPTRAWWRPLPPLPNECKGASGC